MSEDKDKGEGESRSGRERKRREEASQETCVGASKKKAAAMLRVGAQRRAIIPPRELEKVGAEEGDLVLVSVKKMEVKALEGEKEEV